MSDPTDRAVAAITRTLHQGGDPTWTAHAILTALRGLGWRPTNAQPPPAWQGSAREAALPTAEWHTARNDPDPKTRFLPLY